MQRNLLYFAAFTGMGSVFMATLIVAALVLGGTGQSDDARVPASPGVSAAVADGPLGEITITAFDLGFEPAMIDLERPGTYTVTFVNDGAIYHDVTFADGTVIGAEGHQSATGEVVIPAEGTTFICSVPGHADGGMTGEVMVGMASGSGVPAPSGVAEERTAEEMRDVDAAVTAQFPALTEGKGNQLLEPEIQPDGTLQWEITASVIEWETEPGTVLEAFAYNGTVPGPRLEAEVGDKVRVIFRNELPEPSTIHFHGQIVPNNMDGVPVISQPAVMPGEEFVYEFTVRNGGSQMYHSHFMAEHQVPIGLLGAFVITDPEVSEPSADIDYAMILNDGPLGYTINGKGFPATEPIVAQQGQTIRIRYMNEGLQIHPMHLHGLPQQVIAKDGWLLPQPHFEDTVLVAPGERIDVLVEATELGAWAYHCHVLTHAEGPDGMFGMVTALIVEE